MERASQTAAALAGQVWRQRGDHRQPQSRRQPGGVFEDADAALAELQKAWADGGYHGFCVLEPSVWSAISSSGEPLTGRTGSSLDRTETDA